MRRLIINADDFGFTRDVNAGIVKAHLCGILTSTTLMANGKAFEDAVRLAQETPSLDVGCHLVLVQGQSLLTKRPLPKGPRQLVAALATGSIDIRSELKLQIEKILAAGLKPTHLDTHKHTHVLPRVFREVVGVAAEYHIPYVRIPLITGASVAAPLYRRIASGKGVYLPDHFAGFRLTGSLNKGTFAAALYRLRDGLTEFMCHPGELGAELAAAQTRLRESRVRELETLTSPEIRDLIMRLDIQLLSFGKVANG